MRISAITEGKKKYVALGLLFIGWLMSFLDRMVMNIAVIPIKEEFNLIPHGRYHFKQFFYFIRMYANTRRLAVR